MVRNYSYNLKFETEMSMCKQLHIWNNIDRGSGRVGIRVLLEFPDSAKGIKFFNRKFVP